MIPVAIIDWDRARPGTRLANFAEFLWAFVYPAMYGGGEPAARMLRTAADAYGWSGPGLVDAMLATVRHFRPSSRRTIGTGRAGAPGTQRRPVPGLAARLTGDRRRPERAGSALQV